jgi:F-type H+-transporting ATPase subunit b
MLDFSVTLIITVFNIVFLAFLLRKILFKPVNKFMAERAKRISDSIAAAESDRANARETLEGYRGKLAAADAEAEEIVRSARLRAEAQADAIVAEGKAEAREIVERARAQVESERRKALALFGMEAAAVIAAASSRLVRREFSAEDGRLYAGMLMDELAAARAPSGRP